MPLTALSPLDGRYASQLQPLAALCSESGLMRHRVMVEVAWFKALAACPEFAPLPALDARDQAHLDAVVESFSDADAAAIKTIEQTTRHDVKAVEYWLKDQLSERPELAAHAEMVHFACTSEDINNCAWALILLEARQAVLQPLLMDIDHRLQAMAQDHARLPMLSRTHGQTASPTTLGKEMANVVFRLRRQRRQLAAVEISAKLNGAVGNFNAHMAACPEVDWPALSRQVIESLGLVWNPYTTQIEPHDMIAELAHALMRINTILLDLARDLWTYISLGYFRQKLKDGEVGSSTMPHKINPIDFENAEGNLGIANALLAHLADKLPVSRLQRDLSDSTVLRNLGPALGHCALAWQSLLKGLDRISPDEARIAADLDQSLEVLAEAIQTVMRAQGQAQPYEQLKALTRGQRIDAEAIRRFIAELPLSEDSKQRLMAMTPADYTGNAAEMAAMIDRFS
jgi:adenylosuccinate lyase